MKIIYFGSDHAGYALKEELKYYLEQKKFGIFDVGTFSNKTVDYPDITKGVCDKIAENKNAFGILICGTGIGMTMAANKHPGIRAALCTHEIMAKMARFHNDANILCLGARIIAIDLAKHIVDIFLQTEFETDERHRRRILKMEQLFISHMTDSVS